MEWVEEDSRVGTGSTWSSSRMAFSGEGKRWVEDKVVAGGTCHTASLPQESSLPDVARGQTSREVHRQAASLGQS